MRKKDMSGLKKNISVGISMYNPSIEMYCGKAFKDGAEFGYNKAKEENEKLTAAKDLLKRWVDDRVYTVSEQKDLIADTEQFLEEE